MTDELDELIEVGARAHHEAYERLAVEHGYSTREATRVEWDDLPENMRALMLAAERAALLEGLAHRQRSVCGKCEVARQRWTKDSPWSVDCDACGNRGTVEGETVLTLRSAVRAEVEGEYEQVGWTEPSWYPDDMPDDTFPFLLWNRLEAPYADAAPVYRQRVESPHRSEP